MSGMALIFGQRPKRQKHVSALIAAFTTGCKAPDFLANNQSKYDLAVGSVSWQYFEAGNRPSTAAMTSFVIFTPIEVSDFIDI
jgi:hypothetical protein